MEFPNYPRTVNSVQEILDLADKYQIPLNQCRFFINQDIQEPRAFGIYYDGINWIVYKNKANGERAIRYQGEDEAYAAQEIWSKFLSEVDARRTNSLFSNYSDRNANNEKRSSESESDALAAVFKIAFLFIICFLSFNSLINSIKKSNGYYKRDNQIYYYQQDQWYLLDGDEWFYYDGDLTGFSQYNYYGDYDFEDSDYYVQDSSSYDYDDGWDIDWDGWDLLDTDWDLDW